MRYLNTKNIIAAGVLLSCMSSIAWGAIIPDRTRIIMNEGNDSNLLIVFYVQIMPDDFVMQLHRF
ncbi:hypothetical protein C6B41_19920 [Escherichia coli]|nr:hypothetical protein C6B30_20390 [Escherichia coli]RCE21681.1 hypothetical protein C6B41_19920 [Escherichia coli]RCF49454.1 hypothetical protein C6B03_20445 [Escherichia coli]